MIINLMSNIFVILIMFYLRGVFIFNIIFMFSHIERFESFYLNKVLFLSICLAIFKSNPLFFIRNLSVSEKVTGSFASFN